VCIPEDSSSHRERKHRRRLKFQVRIAFELTGYTPSCPRKCPVKQKQVNPMSDRGMKILTWCIRWFVLSGSVGLLVAILLWVIGNLDPTRLSLLRISSVPFPMMILMLAGRTTPADKVLLVSGML
jgi:hypothetical protein